MTRHDSITKQTPPPSEGLGEAFTLTLLELNSLVRQVIEHTLNGEYWVEAELSECRDSRGHCYMELVQKDERSATPIARASAKCWRTQWAMLQPYFERTTGQPLHAGMKVRLKVYAQFHEAYGFSWIVTDIDPTFTLGDMARRRMEIIRQLKAEGVFDMQKELQLPLFCQRIAVISSATAAGYGDFVDQLVNNERGLQFQVQLFPAIMQGEQVEQSIISALNQIYSVECRTESVELATAPEANAQEATAVANSKLYTLNSKLKKFDCVVIIRGGGATADMSGFDTLALAENVAQFPLPIITGIGHDRDECILDMVSHTRVKTPTAAAALLVSHLSEVYDAVSDAQERIARYVQNRIALQKTQITNLKSKIQSLFSVVKSRQEARLDGLYNRIVSRAQQKMATSHSQLTAAELRLPLLLDRRMTAERHRLELLEEKMKVLDPSLLLRRGYSITLKDGKAVRDANALTPGDELVTRLANGTVRSTVLAE